MSSNQTYTKEQFINVGKFYISKGAKVIPVAFKGKAPKGKNWVDRDISSDQVEKIWSEPNNIGLLIGSKSGNLIDIDLDCDEAVELAPHFLPNTNAIHGRVSRPRSHWYYYCPSLKTKRFADPDGAGKGETMLVECRSDGVQTVVPPSIHPSGERLSWDTEEFDPAPVEAVVLLKAVSRLSAASLLARYWPEEGKRQECAMALAGVLLRAGFSEDEAVQFIDAVCTAQTNKAEDDPNEAETRSNVVAHTKERLDSDENVYGLTKLGEIIGEKPAKKVGEWLGIKKSLSFVADSEENSVDFSQMKNSDIPLKVLRGRIHKIPPVKDPKPKPICSFYAKLKKVVIDEEGREHLVVQLINCNQMLNVTFPPEAWISAERFKKHLPNRHFNFTGTGDDVQHLREFISQDHAPEVKGVKEAGFVDGAFVTEEGCLLPDRTMSDSAVFLGERPTRCGLISTNAATENELAALSKHLPYVNDPTVSLPVLGWTFACFLKPHFVRRVGKFPLLNIEGQKESGKTSTLSDIIAPIWALSSSPASIASCTSFTLMKAVSNSNAIPVIFDEHKSNRMSFGHKNVVSGMIRSAYDSNEGERGRADQSTVVYSYSAPLVVAGESGFIEPALLDRFVFAHCSAEKSQPYFPHFDECRGLNLPGLGRSALEAALNMSEAFFDSLYGAEFDAVDERLKNRPRHNATVARIGICLMEKLLNISLDKTPIDDAIIKGIGIVDGGERKSVVDHILEYMGTMSLYKTELRGGEQNTYNFKVFQLDQDVGLIDGTHYGIKDGQLRISFAASYELFKKAAKSYDYEGDVPDKSTFLRQLKDEPYYIGSKSLHLCSRSAPVHCYILSVFKMVNKGIDVPDNWLVDTFDDNCPL